MVRFILAGIGARWSYRRRKAVVPTTVPDGSPAWAKRPAVAVSRPGRAGSTPSGDRAGGDR
ncbi:hypothetical protein [Micromonospora lupini]|uniref:hypothetical protein n=1 Tax=Micromonospora lupini TaxID=285679 RepID=UPI0031DC81D8